VEHATSAHRQPTLACPPVVAQTKTPPGAPPPLLIGAGPIQASAGPASRVRVCGSRLAYCKRRATKRGLRYETVDPPGGRHDARPSPGRTAARPRTRRVTPPAEAWCGWSRSSLSDAEWPPGPKTHLKTLERGVLSAHLLSRTYARPEMQALAWARRARRRPGTCSVGSSSSTQSSPRPAEDLSVPPLFPPRRHRLPGLLPSVLQLRRPTASIPRKMARGGLLGCTLFDPLLITLGNSPPRSRKADSSEGAPRWGTPWPRTRDRRRKPSPSEPVHIFALCCSRDGSDVGGATARLSPRSRRVSSFRGRCSTPFMKRPTTPPGP